MFQCWLFKFDEDTLEQYPTTYEKLSFEKFFLSLPEGVYTTLRTVGKNKIFQFKYHLNRLMESYSLSKGVFPYDINKLRPPLFKIITQFPAEEFRELEFTFP